MQVAASRSYTLNIAFPCSKKRRGYCMSSNARHTEDTTVNLT